MLRSGQFGIVLYLSLLGHFSLRQALHVFFVHIMDHTVRCGSPWLNTRWVAIQDGLNRWNVLETARDFVLLIIHSYTREDLFPPYE